MRSVNSIKNEITELNGPITIFKWLAIINFFASIGAGISTSSLTVFAIGFCSSVIFTGVWSSFLSRQKRLLEEIEERRD